MTERVMLYSRYLITIEELNIILQAIQGKPVALTDEYGLLGRVEDGERHILISGQKLPMEASRFWEQTLFYLGPQLLDEICTKLGAKPVVSFHIGIGFAPKSGLLAVLFAHQCAICWPCIVYADVFDEEKDSWTVKVYAKEDIARLLSTGEAFSNYGMGDAED